MCWCWIYLIFGSNFHASSLYRFELTARCTQFTFTNTCEHERENRESWIQVYQIKFDDRRVVFCLDVLHIPPHGESNEHTMEEERRRTANMCSRTTMIASSSTETCRSQAPPKTLQAKPRVFIIVINIITNPKNQPVYQRGKQTLSQCSWR